MRITSTQLRQIIREELERSINEGFFDSAKRALGFGPTHEEAREAAVKALRAEGGGEILYPPGHPRAGAAVPDFDFYTLRDIVDNKVREMFPEDAERFLGPTSGLAGAPARAAGASSDKRRLTRAASGVYFK